MLNLTTNITMPNVNKVDVYDLDDKRDHPDDPRFAITMKFRGVGDRYAGTFTVVGRDAEPSTAIIVNPSPAGYCDVILYQGSKTVAGACTAMAAAYDAASGNRQAKREAVYLEAINIGLIDAALVAT